MKKRPKVLLKEKQRAKELTKNRNQSLAIIKLMGISPFFLDLPEQVRNRVYSTRLPTVNIVYDGDLETNESLKYICAYLVASCNWQAVEVNEKTYKISVNDFLTLALAVHVGLKGTRVANSDKRTIYNSNKSRIC